MSIERTLATGLEFHRVGRLGEAERAYRQVLEWEPAHPLALHQLGILALQAGQFDAAIDLLGRAVRGDRRHAAFFANLGEAYRHAGKLDAAVDAYRQAIKLDPNLAQAHKLLGIVLHAQGREEEACEALRRALNLVPDDAEARACLGQAMLARKKYADAEACFRRALRDDARSPNVHFRLAGALQEQGKLEEAADCYQQALALDPNYADAHNNLGTIRRAQERLDEAAFHYQEAIRINPNYAAAHVNRGLLEERQGRLEAAAATLRRAIELDPTLPRAWHSLADVLLRQGNEDEAVAAVGKALRLDPADPSLWLAQASHHQKAGRTLQAMDCCREALRLDPRYAEAHHQLGALWALPGHHDEAIACLRRALELKPRFAEASSNLAYSLQSLGLLDEAVEAHRNSVAWADEQAAPRLHSSLVYCLNYHPAYDAARLFEEHRAWGLRWADPLTLQSPPHANDRAPDRRLRVGYCSPNFKAHAVNFFVEPVLAAHDHAQVEVFCYADVDQEDDTTRRLRAAADHWRDTRLLDDSQLADAVRADRIDVLVDLTGHINGGRRSLAFARKPAPVQVTYIGYQNTTGMLAMDYRLTDDYADPPGLTDALHTEKLYRLPGTFFCYQPSADAPPEAELPAARNGYVTFGSLNAFNKVTPEVLRVWAALVVRVPGSRLMIRADMTESLRGRLLDTIARHGIETDRLELVNRLPRPAYLELINRVDVALDPFPFNGHTTTCDCLWQGVPVVSLSGTTYVTRFGASGLVAAGLDELVARSPKEYLEIAAELAADVERLAAYRRSLRGRLAASPLLDFAGFTRKLEAAYRQMWRDWCAREG